MPLAIHKEADDKNLQCQYNLNCCFFFQRKDEKKSSVLIKRGSGKRREQKSKERREKISKLNTRFTGI